MTDRTYLVRGKQYVRVLLEMMIEAEMSMGDTVTIGDFINSKPILTCMMTDLITGLQLTCTTSNNVVTMTNAGTNLHVVIMTVGEAA